MPPSIQVYEGEGAPRGLAVRKMLKQPLPKRPVYVIHRKDDGDGYQHLSLFVRGTGEYSSMRDPYFSIRWQGGVANRDRVIGDETMNRWYGGTVELTGKARHDLKLHVRWLHRLIEKIGTVDIDPMEVVAALESLGVAEGAYDDVTDTYRPTDRMVPEGFARWHEVVTGSSMMPLDVVAETEDEAKALLDERMAKHGYYDNRLDAWRAAGRPVTRYREAKRPRHTKDDIPFKRGSHAEAV